MSFKRARQDDQKAERRIAILQQARLLCQEYGALEWSLNELGRRADISKSNLYRYFGSREEILMVLMHEEIAEFSRAFVASLANRKLSLEEACSELASNYNQRPFLCDLLSVSSTVLEKNTDLPPILKIKLEGLNYQNQVAQAIEQSVDEIGFATAKRLAFFSGILVAGLWPMARPAAPMRELAKHEGMESLSLNFSDELLLMLKAQLLGLLSKD